MPTEPPKRGFSAAEYHARLMALSQEMHRRHLDAVLLASEHEIRYYSGFHSPFWHSLTRPWFLLIPKDSAPIAIIPSIGALGMEQGGIARVCSWSSPDPDDEGIRLLISEIEKLPAPHRRLGVMLGAESYWRVAQNDITALRKSLASWQWVDVADTVWQQRLVKSPAEIAKIGYVAEKTSALMHDLPRHLRAKQTEREIAHLLHRQLLDAGLDHVPFLIASSGKDGYNNIIMEPTERTLGTGDVLILDTGAQYDGYFCDFNRNYAFGTPNPATRDAHARLWQITEQALTTLRPGMTTDTLFKLFRDALAPYQMGDNSIGRMGHGLGMGLTEWPSIHPKYRVPLPVGAVMTLEPSLMFAPGCLLTHEENIVLTENGARLLSQRAPEELFVINQ